jgi:hypothetical protein
VVERSPEKAGVGGSTPSLATIKSITYLERFLTTLVQLGTKILACQESCLTAFFSFPHTSAMCCCPTRSSAPSLPTYLGHVAEIGETVRIGV